MPEYRLGNLKGEYVVTWKEDGARRRYRLFAKHEAPEVRRDRKEALRRLTAFESQALAQSRLTVKGIWDSYKKEKEGSWAAAHMRYEWKTIGETFGHLYPENITPQLCRSYIRKRRENNIQDGTIWTEMGRLRTALNWAAKIGLIEKAPQIQRPAKPAPKERFLTREECEQLIHAAETPHIRLAIILMLSTACRVGAALDLTWDRVHFDTGVIDLRLSGSATRKGRAIVPMNSGLRAALLEAKAGALTDHVIEYNEEAVKSIKTGFNATVRRAKLSDVTAHVLRHTAAVHLAQAGVRIEKIAQYLGHSNPQITYQVYARFSPDHMQKEAEILDFTSIRRFA